MKIIYKSILDNTIIIEQHTEEPNKKGRPTNDRPPKETKPRGRPRLIKQPQDPQKRGRPKIERPPKERQKSGRKPTPKH